MAETFGRMVLEEYLGVFKKYFNISIEYTDLGLKDNFAMAKPEWGRIAVHVNLSQGLIYVSYTSQDLKGAEVRTMTTPLTNPNGKLMFKQQLEKAFGFSAETAKNRNDWWAV